MTPFNVVEIVALVYLGHLLQTYAQTAGSQEANIPCYWAANKTLDPAFVPCGDPNTGVKWCCEVGSNCLANNSCYMSLCEPSHCPMPACSLKLKDLCRWSDIPGRLHRSKLHSERVS